jgi:hypothetical protein
MFSYKITSQKDAKIALEFLDIVISLTEAEIQLTKATQEHLAEYIEEQRKKKSNPTD